MTHEYRGWSRGAAAVAFLVAGMSLAEAANNVSFSGTAQIATDMSGVNRWAHADLNGDGEPDWVTNAASIKDERLIAIIVAGTKHVVTTADSLTALDVGDMDGDGKVDVLVGGYHNGITEVSVLWNPDGGTWGDSTGIPIDGYICDIKVSDLERDGDNDIVVFGKMPSTLRAKLTWVERSGTAWNTHTIDTGFMAMQDYSGWVLVDDFNEDSLPDIIVGSNYLGNTPIIEYLNAGDGSFTKKVISYAMPTIKPAVGDIDFDGDLDLFLGKTWLQNDGLGSFTSVAMPSPPANNPDALAYGDVTGDGYPELAEAVYGSGVYLWRNPDNSGWVNKLITTDANVKGIEFTDVNNDGFTDVALMLETPGELKYMQNSGVGAFASMSTLAAMSNLVDYTMADLDGDGDQDIIAVARSSTVMYNTYYVWENVGSGIFVQRFSTTTSTSPYYAFYSSAGLRVGDFNGDGKMDFVAMNDRQLGWYEQVSLTNFTQHFFGSTYLGDSYTSVDVADWDHDGDLDVLGLLDNGAKALLLYSNDGSGSFSKADTLKKGLYYYGLAAGDLNGDSLPELIYRLNVSPNTNIWTTNQNPTLTRIISYVDSGDGLAPAVTHIMDVDGDGDSDLLVASRDSGSAGWFENLGDTNGDNKLDWKVHTLLWMTSPSPSDIAAGDIDLDGKTDFLYSIVNDKNAYWMSKDVYTLAGDAVIDKVRLVDLDQDGGLDAVGMTPTKIIWFRNQMAAKPAVPPEHPEPPVSLLQDSPEMTAPSGARAVCGVAGSGSHLCVYEVPGEQGVHLRINALGRKVGGLD